MQDLFQFSADFLLQLPHPPKLKPNHSHRSQYCYCIRDWSCINDTVNPHKPRQYQYQRYEEQHLSGQGQEYTLAARTLGASDVRLMFKHIFPNSLGTIVTSAVMIIPGVIFSESSLTYLGIVNLDSTTRSSVGSMLSNGRAYFTTDPYIILFPALFISLLEISFNLFGNGLRDAFNPSLRGAED